MNLLDNLKRFPLNNFSILLVSFKEQMVKDHKISQKYYKYVLNSDVTTFTIYLLYIYIFFSLSSLGNLLFKIHIYFGTEGPFGPCAGLRAKFQI